MPNDNLVLVSGHASNDVGLQPASNFSGDNVAVVPATFVGKEAPLPPRRRPSGQQTVVKFVGPARHFHGGDDLGAEYSKFRDL